MDITVLSEMLSKGNVFAIETNKAMNMMDGAPAEVMLKVSRYNIGLLAAMPIVDSWWKPTGTKHIVCKKGHSPRLYLLCALHKGAGFGESSFFAMDEHGEFIMDKAYSKAEVEKFLPPKEPFTADFMTLPIDSIESLELLDSKPAKSEEWVCPDKPLNARPVCKPAPWHNLPTMFPKPAPVVPAWDPEFAPLEYA
jgi:hypothetical protein